MEWELGALDDTDFGALVSKLTPENRRVLLERARVLVAQSANPEHPHGDEPYGPDQGLRISQ